VWPCNGPCCGRLLETAGLFAARALAGGAAEPAQGRPDPAGLADGPPAPPPPLSAGEAAAAESLVLWALEQGQAVVSLAAHKHAHAAAAASRRGGSSGAGGDAGENVMEGLEGAGLEAMPLGPGMRP